MSDRRSPLAFAAAADRRGDPPRLIFEIELEMNQPRVWVDVDSVEDARRLVQWLFARDVAERVFAALDRALETAAGE